MYDVSPLPDAYYDDLGKQLMMLQKEYGDIGDTKYGYAFKDFEGSTGFYLYYRLTEKDKSYLTSIAEHALTKYIQEG